LKLDRLLAKHSSLGRTAAHRALAAKLVKVDGQVISDAHLEIDRFMRVVLAEEVIREADQALYFMLHKPIGYVSATIDDEHPTVIDLIDHPDKATLHLAGRLDRNTSGLVLLTNDGRWSKRITEAKEKVPKIYRVETLDPIPMDAVALFAEGFYFPTEDIMTLPANLEIIGEREARLTIHEGRYHQIKRMFHRVNNRVTKLHRESIGSLVLPPDLAPGQWRELTHKELQI
jgi:16S rRNA pseudouridine516 synthase